jgi:hypothetical protein
MSQQNVDKIKQGLQQYRRRYLKEDFLALDESATRIMINFLLTQILGYEELVDIKTEFRIKGEYADYILQLNGKKKFVVEVKSIQIDLSDKHLKQSLSYAANEGIDWIILLNGRQLQLHKVLFEKPIDTKLVFSFNFLDESSFKASAECIWLLSKKATEKNALEEYWKKFDASSPKNLSKMIYSETIVKYLRKELKKKTGLNFDENDVADSLYKVIVEPTEFIKPKLKKEVKKSTKSAFLNESDSTVISTAPAIGDIIES